VERGLPYGRSVSDHDRPASDEALRDRVARLSRPQRGGRRVIERAAILAEGADSAAILDWLAAASWAPEDAPAAGAHRGGSGLHGMRQESQRGQARPEHPRRYVSPSTDDLA
jgi:hypothetical protein